MHFSRFLAKAWSRNRRCRYCTYNLVYRFTNIAHFKLELNTPQLTVQTRTVLAILYQAVEMHTVDSFVAVSIILLFVAGYLGKVECSKILEQFPTPSFSMNLTQDDNVGLEKRVFRRLNALNNDESATAPLFEGMGTHYSFIWVGTPAQRVSVIMDTGSHHTAFPCTGCKCGKHVSLIFCNCMLCYLLILALQFSLLPSRWTHTLIPKDRQQAQ